MRIEEITTTAALEALEPEWTELLSRCPDPAPFLSPCWLLPWWRILGGGDLWTLALREDGRLVALAPLFVFLQDGRRHLAFLGSGISDELDLLAEPRWNREAAGRVLQHLESRPRWDTGALVDLPPQSALLSAARAAARTVEDAENCHVLPLPPTVETFRRGLRPNHRRNLRRARTLLEARGALRFERAGPAEVQERLSALFRLHEARWHGRGEPGVLASDALRAFHRAAAAGLAAAGWLRLRTLHVAERAAAALYGFARGRRAFAYLGGFDPEFAQGSPGTLLTSWAIEESIAEGATSYDFLRGDEPHKLTWGTQPVPRRRVRLEPCVSC